MATCRIESDFLSRAKEKNRHLGDHIAPGWIWAHVNVGGKGGGKVVHCTLVDHRDIALLFANRSQGGMGMMAASVAGVQVKCVPTTVTKRT